MVRVDVPLRSRAVAIEQGELLHLVADVEALDPAVGAELARRGVPPPRGAPPKARRLHPPAVLRAPPVDPRIPAAAVGVAGDAEDVLLRGFADAERPVGIFL